ncbi:MAG: hypothetical protein K6F05_07305 [Succinivibrio sp.]|nr:hypothetical protein [Succinivibrio sp.]
MSENKITSTHPVSTSINPAELQNTKDTKPLPDNLQSAAAVNSPIHSSLSHQGSAPMAASLAGAQPLQAPAPQVSEQLTGKGLADLLQNPNTQRNALPEVFLNAVENNLKNWSDTYKNLTADRQTLQKFLDVKSHNSFIKELSALSSEELQQGLPKLVDKYCRQAKIEQVLQENLAKLVTKSGALSTSEAPKICKAIIRTLMKNPQELEQCDTRAKLENFLTQHTQLIEQHCAYFLKVKDMTSACRQQALDLLSSKLNLDRNFVAASFDATALIAAVNQEIEKFYAGDMQGDPASYFKQFTENFLGKHLEVLSEVKDLKLSEAAATQMYALLLRTPLPDGIRLKGQIEAHAQGGIAQMLSASVALSNLPDAQLLEDLNSAAKLIDQCYMNDLGSEAKWQQLPAASRQLLQDLTCLIMFDRDSNLKTSLSSHQALARANAEAPGAALLRNAVFDSPETLMAGLRNSDKQISGLILQALAPVYAQYKQDFDDKLSFDGFIHKLRNAGSREGAPDLLLDELSRLKQFDAEQFKQRISAESQTIAKSDLITGFIEQRAQTLGLGINADRKTIAVQLQSVLQDKIAQVHNREELTALMNNPDTLSELDLQLKIRQAAVNDALPIYTEVLKDSGIPRNRIIANLHNTRQMLMQKLQTAYRSLPEKMAVNSEEFDKFISGQLKEEFTRRASLLKGLADNRSLPEHLKQAMLNQALDGSLTPSDRDNLKTAQLAAHMFDTSALEQVFKGLRPGTAPNANKLRKALTGFNQFLQQNFPTQSEAPDLALPEGTLERNTKLQDLTCQILMQQNPQLAEQLAKISYQDLSRLEANLGQETCKLISYARAFIADSYLPVKYREEIQTHTATKDVQQHFDNVMTYGTELFNRHKDKIPKNLHSVFRHLIGSRSFADNRRTEATEYIEYFVNDISKWKNFDAHSCPDDLKQYLTMQSKHMLSNLMNQFSNYADKDTGCHSTFVADAPRSYVTIQGSLHNHEQADVSIKQLTDILQHNHELDALDEKTRQQRLKRQIYVITGLLQQGAFAELVSFSAKKASWENQQGCYQLIHNTGSPNEPGFPYQSLANEHAVSDVRFELGEDGKTCKLTYYRNPSISSNIDAIYGSDRTLGQVVLTQTITLDLTKEWPEIQDYSLSQKFTQSIHEWH